VDHEQLRQFQVDKRTFHGSREMRCDGAFHLKPDPPTAPNQSSAWFSMREIADFFARSFFFVISQPTSAAWPSKEKRMGPVRKIGIEVRIK